MARISVVLGAVMVILCLNIVQARMYFLPDYQTGAYLKRSNDSALGQSVSSSGPKSCADLSGFISADQKGNMDCNIVKSLPGIGICYSDCYCNTSTYKYSTSNCSYTLTGSVCVSDKSYYTECKQTCNDVIHKSCTYGCQSAYSVCSSKCQTCYADNCRNRTSKSCDYGCQSYYADCPSKCETCKTCTPTNCSAYTLSSCPANGNCSSCTAGCGNNTLKYKLDSCNSGYNKSGNTCVVACSLSGYTLSSCPANGNCTSKTCSGTTKYKLDSCKSGYTQSGNSCIDCSSICIDESSCEYPGDWNSACGCMSYCCEKYYSYDELCAFNDRRMYCNPDGRGPGACAMPD